MAQPAEASRGAEERPRRNLRLLPRAHRRGAGRLHQGRAREGARRQCEGARIDHSFLFRPGSWRAEGEYRDASGQAAPVSGETSIRHEEGKWRFEGVLRVRGNRPALQHNRYEIEPMTPGARSTHWTSSNPVLGTLRGRFVLAGDAILSF